MKLSIVIPAHNQEETLATVVERVRAVPLSIEKEIIVVDDGSTDGTRRLFETRLQAEVQHCLFQHKTLGRGAASLLVGFERKRALHASVLPVAFTAIFLYLGYFAVCLLTPYELAWHLRTSLERLLAHPAPVLILWCLLSLGTFEPGNRPSPAPP